MRERVRSAAFINGVVVKASLLTPLVTCWTAGRSTTTFTCGRLPDVDVQARAGNKERTRREIQVRKDTVYFRRFFSIKIISILSTPVCTG